MRGVLPVFAFFALLTGVAVADSIIVDGKTYSGVKIRQSDTRYYVRLSDGTAISVAKDTVKPDQIVFGDKPLPIPSKPVNGPAPAPAKAIPPAPKPLEATKAPESSKAEVEKTEAAKEAAARAAAEEAAKVEAAKAEAAKARAEAEAAKAETKAAKEEAAKLEAAKAEAAKVEAAKLEAAKAEAAKAEAAKMEAAKARAEAEAAKAEIEAAKVEAAKVEALKAEAAKAEAAKMEAVKARAEAEAAKAETKAAKEEAAKIEAAKAEAAKVEAAKAEAAKAEAAKVEAAKAEAAKVEAAKAEAAKVEAAKAEAAKVEAAKVEAAKVEAAKLEAAKVEAAKVEAAKAEAAKVEAAKVEAAKAEAAKVEAAKAEAAKARVEAEAAKAEMEAAKAEAAKAEAARARAEAEAAKAETKAAKEEAARMEAAKVEAAKAEAAKAEAAKAEAAKVEAAKVEAAKVEAAKVEAAKVEAAKAEAARMEAAKVEAAKVEAAKAEAVPCPPPMPEAAPLSAGAATLEIKEGEKLPLCARALVMNSGGDRVALCLMGAGRISQAVTDSAARQLKALGSALSGDQLLISSSEAADLTFSPARDAATVSEETLGTLVAQTVRRAESALAPVQVRIGEAEVPEFQELRKSGSTTADSTLTVLAVESPEGKAQAYLVNMALPANEKQRETREAIEAALSQSLAQDQAKVPVLYMNGAAGDIELKLPPGGGAVLGRTLGDRVREALREVKPITAAPLRCWAHQAVLPVSLADETSKKVTLHELRLGNTAFFSMPGSPAAQIGLLMRVKAMVKGAEHVFLLANSGADLGFQCTIEEYFAVTDATRVAPYGPLWILWYGSNYFACQSEEPVWTDIPAIARNSAAFRSGVERGKAQCAAVHAAWVANKAGVEKLADMLDKGAGSNTRVAKQSLPEENPAAKAYRAALAIRSEYANFTEEERVTLMGVSEGARLPFDMVLLAQVLARPEALTPELRKLAAGFRDFPKDFLGK